MPNNAQYRRRRLARAHLLWVAVLGAWLGALGAWLWEMGVGSIPWWGVACVVCSTSAVSVSLHGWSITRPPTDPPEPRAKRDIRLAKEAVDDAQKRVAVPRETRRRLTAVPNEPPARGSRA